VGRGDRALEGAHPGVRVERQVGPNNSTQLHDLLSQRLRNREASLDLFLMDVVWTAEFAAAGWALHVPLRRGVLAVVLAVSMFPQVALVGGLYGILRDLSLLNTYPGL
jgi:hypothetical protein